MNTDYLKTGKQTLNTPQITHIVSSIKGEGLDFIANTLIWIHKNIRIERAQDMSLFRKRTADQIITDKLSTGCTDTALIFISITRAKGIPTKYVEVFSKKWLEKGGDILAGHVYAECFINDKWMQIDPHLCRIHPLIDYHNYEIYEKGLDSWDLGIDSFEEMKKVALAFREQFLKHISSNNLSSRL